jgi:predicted SAM-dependent methyltransferase
MRYLNLGCGNHFSTMQEWTNIDFYSESNHVISRNLLNGIPFEDNYFDFVYHSHVFEHFNKNDGINFMNECIRVLKPGGVIRIVVPDLEQIVREYLQKLENVINDPSDPVNEANYDWIMLELFDQTVRNKGGGDMGEYLTSERIINEDFVYSRIGLEGRNYRDTYLSDREKPASSFKNKILRFNLKRILHNISIIIANSPIIPYPYRLGKFRLSGEIHQWMYDYYSVARLMRNCGCNKIIKRDAFTSYIPDWSNYGLDGKQGEIRKPDSIFVEALKLIE